MLHLSFQTWKMQVSTTPRNTNYKLGFKTGFILTAFKGRVLEEMGMKWHHVPGCESGADCNSLSAVTTHITSVHREDTRTHRICFSELCGSGYAQGPSIKGLLTCWAQLLMTVFRVLPDGPKSNLTFILNKHHVHSSMSSRERCGCKLTKYHKGRVRHVYHQFLHHGFNRFSPPAPVIHHPVLRLLFLIGPVTMLTGLKLGHRDTDFSNSCLLKKK